MDAIDRRLMAAHRRITNEQQKEIDRLRNENFVLRQRLELARLATYGLFPRNLLSRALPRSGKQ